MMLVCSCCRFNLIAFSRSCSSWKTGVVDPMEENCHDAAQWITELVANGNTCTLEALTVLGILFCSSRNKLLIYFVLLCLLCSCHLTHLPELMYKN